MLLYAYAGISSRQVPKVMELSSLLWGGVDDRIPSHVTVIDWVEKCGLSLAEGSLRKKTAAEAYSLVIDNSITLCGQDLHLELMASSVHPGHPHSHADVSVVSMVAGRQWDAESTRRELDKTIARLGYAPEYVVCDNGRTVCNASEEAGLPTHRDISHSFGMFLERVYSKDDEFTHFINKKGYARKYSHTLMAPLMPPRRREYARFMNAFETVRWAKAMLENDRLLSSRERWLFSFVRTHASLVEELDEVMKGYEYMEQLCKQVGLSHRTASMCRDYVNRHFMTKGERVRRLGDMIISYFNKEERLLTGDEPHNICSDIIESTFGYLKSRMSPNKSNGYTPLVLLMPLHMRVSTIDDCRSFNAARTIGNTKLNDINKWRADNLLPNPSIKRLNLLKKVS